MLISPTRFDFHAAAALARLLGKHPLFDRSIDSAVQHHVLGGIPFAAAFFYFWVQAEREHRADVLRRLVTILFGSLVAIVLVLIAGNMISWRPPQRERGLAHFYPSYLVPDPNGNSFPSDSTALFTSIAAGMVSVQFITGTALLLAVPVIISLPRMYLGGHYPTDVLAGFGIGLLSYAISLVLESAVSARILEIGQRPGWSRVLVDTCVFLWILEVAVSFREGVWVLNILHYFHVGRFV